MKQNKNKKRHEKQKQRSSATHATLCTYAAFTIEMRRAHIKKMRGNFSAV